MLCGGTTDASRSVHAPSKPIPGGRGHVVFFSVNGSLFDPPLPIRWGGYGHEQLAMAELLHDDSINLEPNLEHVVLSEPV